MKQQKLIISHSDMIDALQLYVNTIRKDGAIVIDLTATMAPGTATTYDVVMISGAESMLNELKKGK